MSKRFSQAMVLAVVLSLASGVQAKLVGWWKLNEGAGPTVADSSGNGLDGTLTDATWRNPGYNGAGWCIELNRAGYVDLGNPKALDMGTGDWTVTAWINTTITGTSEAERGTIYAKGGDNGGGHRYTLCVAETQEGRVTLTCDDDVTKVQATGTTLVNDGEWHLVVGQRAGTTIRVGANGVFDGQNTVAATYNLGGTSQHNAYIGAITNHTDSSLFKKYKGLIDDVRVYTDALSAQQVAQLLTFTPEGIASSPSPADKATDVPFDTALRWMAGATAQKHNVYLGAAFTDVNTATAANPMNVLVGPGLADTTYQPAAGLDFGKTYYWRVDEVNAPPTSTIFKGEVWSFTVEPYAYPITAKITATASSAQAGMGPENTVNGSGLNKQDQHSTEPKEMWLSAGAQPTWIQYEFDRAYKLDKVLVWNSNQMIETFIGFGAKKVTIETSGDGTTWTPVANVPEFARGTGLAGYAANTTVSLGGVVAKYVKLTINSPWGFAPQTGLSEVRFFYVPVEARAPQPAAAAKSVAVDTSLDWRAGREAVSHKVYFGADANAVANGTVAAKTVTERTFSPGALNLATTYYWRVDEVGAATYPGSVWSFTTQAYGVVDDFESYTDKAGEEVFSAWVDGFENPAKNGAVVGLATAANGTFCDTTNFYAGKKSMPLAYDNTTASLSEATLTLAPARDWTASSVKSLSLWFRGADKNAGQLYVKINSTKVLYNGSATDLAKPLWTRWNIDLSTVAGGVSKVTKLAIGVEGAGAKGTLNVDEIRLYPMVFVAITQPVITKVVRANGQSGTRTDASLITAYTGSTAPAPMPLYGLIDGGLVFSDRIFWWVNTPPALVGVEYVLTFNQDKTAGETDVTYTVTLSRAATVFITCDDRFIPNQQATVDHAVAAFAKPGQFKYTGLKLYFNENATTTDPTSVFAADLPAGTYVFGSQENNCFYTIGVLRK